MLRPLMIACLLSLCAAPLAAETVAETVTRQLQAQGYTRVDSTYTWLGRLRILARQGDLRREIVINPNTGEILRDYESRIVNYAATRSDRSEKANAPVTATEMGAAGDGVSVPDLVEPRTTISSDGVGVKDASE